MLKQEDPEEGAMGRSSGVVGMTPFF